MTENEFLGVEKEGSGEGIQFCSLAYLATTLVACLLRPSLGLEVGRGS